jgi:hypothetical protein
VQLRAARWSWLSRETWSQIAAERLSEAAGAECMHHVSVADAWSMHSAGRRMSREAQKTRCACLLSTFRLAIVGLLSRCYPMLSPVQVSAASVPHRLLTYCRGPTQRVVCYLRVVRRGWYHHPAFHQSASRCRITAIYDLRK